MKFALFYLAIFALGIFNLYCIGNTVYNWIVTDKQYEVLELAVTNSRVLIDYIIAQDPNFYDTIGKTDEYYNYINSISKADSICFVKMH